MDFHVKPSFDIESGLHYLIQCNKLAHLVSLFCLHPLLLRNFKSFFLNTGLLVLTILIAIPYFKVPWDASGMYMMLWLRMLDIGCLDLDKSKLNFRDYIRIWWSSETDEMRDKNILQCKKSPSDGRSRRYLERSVHTRSFGTLDWLKFIGQYFSVILLFLTLVKLQNSARFDLWRPKPWTVLDFADFEMALFYYISAVMLYSMIYLGHQLYSHVISFVFDCPSVLVVANPFVSTSLQDFWANRWNVTTQYSIKRLSYDVLYPRLDFCSKNVRRVISILATFVFSGLMHEWQVYAVLGASRWEQFTFFVLHGVLVLLEMIVCKFVYNMTNYHIFKDSSPGLLMIYSQTVFLATAPLFFSSVILSGAFSNIL
jgi:hypothetical protein